MAARTFKPHNRPVQRLAANNVPILPSIPFRPAQHRPLRCGLVHRAVAPAGGGSIPPLPTRFVVRPADATFFI